MNSTHTASGPPDNGRPAAPRESDGPTPNSQQEPPKPTSDHHTRYPALASRQVSWWAVHEFVTPALRSAESWPMAGTPAWCDLGDDDPRKLAALLDAAQHWALRVEMCQQASVTASHAISAAHNWAEIGNRIRERNEFYAERRWLRRASA
jgi:hypothetical protein